MAERRMFAKSIVTSDAFLDMPPTARCLYFTLGMFADDDGFVNNPKALMRQVGASEDDIRILLAKKFVLAFENGVIVIKHWRIHNYIRGDRKHDTKYAEELSLLDIDENGAYTLSAVDKLTTTCLSNDSQMSVNCPSNDIPRLGKDRLGKDSTISTSILKDEFESLWKRYPKKQGKKQAYAKYASARNKGTTYEEVEKGILAYWDYIEANHIVDQYIKNGSTFFSQEAWNDDWSVRNDHRRYEERGGDASETDYNNWESFAPI